MIIDQHDKGLLKWDPIPRLNKAKLALVWRLPPDDTDGKEMIVLR